MDDLGDLPLVYVAKKEWLSISHVDDGGLTELELGC